MRLSHYRFIDPKLLASLSDLELVARRVVDGFMLGLHQSPQAGVGLEFSQYRSYEPGDDLRRVDWKTYARSDRFYVRESEVETSIAVRLLLDGSGSMAYAENGLSKFDYARFMAACIGYLCHRQGDALGLTVVRRNAVLEVPPDRGTSHWHRFLRRLESVEPSDAWPPWDRLQTGLKSERHRRMLVAVSDLYQQEEELTGVLRKLAAQHEVVVFQIMGGAELDFAFEGSLRFRDLETGRTADLNAAAVRERYQSRLQAYLGQVRRELTDQGVHYELLRMDHPLDAALRAFLERRRRRIDLSP